MGDLKLQNKFIQAVDSAIKKHNSVIEVLENPVQLQTGQHPLSYDVVIKNGKYWIQRWIWFLGGVLG
jgi:hypothetical protein